MMSEQGWHTLSISVADYWPPALTPPRPVASDNPPSEAATTDSDTASATGKAQPPSSQTAANTSRNKDGSNKDGSKSGDSKSGAGKLNSPQQDSNATDPADATPLNPAPHAPWRQREVEWPADQYAGEFAARLELAGGYLRQRSPLPIVTVAVGESAAWLVHQLATGTTKGIQGLVLINIAQPDHAALSLTENLAKLTLPILDLAPRYTPRHSPALRALAMRQAQRHSYEQRLLSANHAQFTDLDNQIVRAVRGWAERQLQPR
jgi:hypothetical protein